jgi:CRISPR-associated protein Cmr6
MLRDRLKGVKWQTQSTHPGLWLEKYYPDAKVESKPIGEFLKDVTTVQASEDYLKFFDNWQKQLKQLNAELLPAQTAPQQRLLIGFGTSILETSLRLHHTWGVPFIPGTAIKGLCSSFAHQRLEDEKWRKDNAFHLELFGNTTQNGAVTFYDALPSSFEIHHDVITVHHPTYYAKGNEAPTDWDDPIPIPFLSITGEFLIALSGNPKAVDLTIKILENALELEGIGAKTSSGYGRLKLTHEKTTQVSNRSLESSFAIAETPSIKLHSSLKDSPDEAPVVYIPKPKETLVEELPLTEMNNAKARDLLESVKIAPLHDKFQKSPGDYIPQFLAMTPDLEVQLEVANSFWDLLTDQHKAVQAKKALDKHKDGKKHWFDLLRELIGQAI